MVILDDIGRRKTNALLEYKRRYGCVVIGVGKLSYYPSSIINGKRDFYLQTSLFTVFQQLTENSNDRRVSV